MAHARPHARRRHGTRVKGGSMRIIEGLLQEMDQEAQTTRRVLERVPQEHLSWKPHPKAMSLGQLATHVAIIPGGVAAGAAQPAIQRPMFQHPTVSDVRQLVPMLDEGLANARTLLGDFSDEQMQAT